MSEFFGSPPTSNQRPKYCVWCGDKLEQRETSAFNIYSGKKLLSLVCGQGGHHSRWVWLPTSIYTGSWVREH